MKAVEVGEREPMPAAGDAAEDVPPRDGAAIPIRIVLLRLVLGVLAPMLVVVAGFGIWNIQLQRDAVNRNLLDIVRKE